MSVINISFQQLIKIFATMDLKMTARWKQLWYGVW